MSLITLPYQTPIEWVEKVEKDFPLFLADHAANERKAAASAMMFVVQYPDKLSLVQVAARIAEEELSHFRLVFTRMKRLGFPLQADEKDFYVGQLLSHVRGKSDERFLDRLLVHSIIEIRAVEKFGLLSKHFSKPSWRKFYTELGESEVGHGYAFLKEAKKLFPDEVVEKRLKEWIKLETLACQKTPITYRFH